MSCGNIEVDPPSCSTILFKSHPFPWLLIVSPRANEVALEACYSVTWVDPPNSDMGGTLRWTQQVGLLQFKSHTSFNSFVWEMMQVNVLDGGVRECVSM